MYNYKVSIGDVSTFGRVEIKIAHVGRMIKKKMRELRIKPAELIGAMHFKSNNSLYYYFKQPTMDTGMLERFSKAMNYNFFKDFLTEEDVHYLRESEVPYVRKDKVMKLEADLINCKNENDQLKDEVIRLQKKLLKDRDMNNIEKSMT